MQPHNNAILEVLIQIRGIVFNIFIFSQKSVEFGGMDIIQRGILGRTVGTNHICPQDNHRNIGAKDYK